MFGDQPGSADYAWASIDLILMIKDTEQALWCKMIIDNDISKHLKYTDWSDSDDDTIKLAPTVSTKTMKQVDFSLKSLLSL